MRRFPSNTSDVTKSRLISQFLRAVICANSSSFTNSAGLTPRRTKASSRAPEKLRIRDAPVLDGLAQPVADLGVAQCEPAIQIDDDGLGLVERSDEVGGGRRIHGRLAAHSRVRGGQQRGHIRNIGDASRECGGNKAHEIRDHATAGGNDKSIAPKPARDEFIFDPLLRGARLVDFASWEGNDVHVPARRRKLSHHTIGNQPNHRRIGDQRNSAIGEPTTAGHLHELCFQPTPHNYRVGLIHLADQLNCELRCFHGTHSFSNEPA